jgi:hypothetical protein
MGEAARHFSIGAPAHRIFMGEVPGRAGEVAIQGEAV